jgi:hypothetical protein
LLIAYKKVIERLETNKKNTTQVAVKCVRILKSHLLQFLPSEETLFELDKFCQRYNATTEELKKVCLFLLLHIPKREREKVSGTADTVLCSFVFFLISLSSTSGH